LETFATQERDVTPVEPSFTMVNVLVDFEVAVIE
jgi:hypothetical protein